ncbi:hypothetical protein ACIQXA_00570 [Streptomyces massasporeus]
MVLGAGCLLSMFTTHQYGRGEAPAGDAVPEKKTGSMSGGPPPGQG